MSEYNEVKRKDFLNTMWAVLGGVVGIEILGGAVSYMQPQTAEGEFGGMITAGPVDDFPIGSVTHFNDGRFYLTRLEDGGFLALHQRCTHLGCNVPWDQQAQKFICPCHSSHFSIEGELETPPAPRPMDLFAVTIEDGIVRVDTSKPIQRQEFDISQVVYA